MGLNDLIPPEITNDGFAKALETIASTKGVRHILEIGASSGEGSTVALVRGAKANPTSPVIYCLEASRRRFGELRKRYKDVPFVRTYNASSVSLADFPHDSEVRRFCATAQGNRLKRFGVDVVSGWLQQDIAYVATSGIQQGGIELIRREARIDKFDAVLIDGSEFTGWAELQLVIGARFIMLDDITTFKNHRGHHSLLSDPRYRLVEIDQGVRHGYSIFELS